MGLIKEHISGNKYAHTTHLLLMLIYVCVSCTEKKHWITESEESKLKIEIITEAVAVPFAIAFLPNDQMLVTDRPTGQIIIIDINTGKKNKIKGVPPIITDGGILDVITHPDFEKNRLIFFAYAAPNEKGATLNVDCAKLVNDSLSERKTLFAAQPYFEKYSFYGSRLILNDGFLFITTGVGKALLDSAQLLSNHLGKIMRIKEDGSVPQDNPFVNTKGALPEIWCYGTRNPQGLVINPLTHELWEHEHGPKGGDEINIINPGKNYGWPVISYGIDYDGAPIGEGKTHHEGMEQPLYQYTPCIAPSGMEFYTGDAFPLWKGNLFIGAMVLKHLNRLVIKDNKVVHEERILKDQQWRVRSVKQGPDGFLYLGVDGGMILRVRPE